VVHGLVHGLSGRRSNRRLDEQTAQKALVAVKRQCGDFGPTLAAEYLRKHPGLFQPTLAPGWKDEEPRPKTETQLGSAFRELGIEWIAAHSPQAKGRVERCFGTLQDRLVKGLRTASAATIEEANRFLQETFLPQWNERFTIQPESAVDAHRPIGDTLSLPSILSHVEQRQVNNDYTVAWQGRFWQIPKEALRPRRRFDPGCADRRSGSSRGSMATVQARIGSRFVILHVCERRDQAIQTTKRRAKRYVPRPRESRWMNAFSVKSERASQAGNVAAAVPDKSACGSEASSPPFPVSPRGKAGAGGFPPRRIKRGSLHKRVAAPLCNPRRVRRGQAAAIRNFLLCGI
jgi:hypothetical protein